MSGTGSGSSFQKKSKPRIVSIQGTKPSIQNAQLLVSTGIPSFDLILGGGLPVGSILLVEEDVYDVYSQLFMKFYLAEGVLNGHFGFLASLNEMASHIYHNLPGMHKEVNLDPQSKCSDEKLKIAWRYQEKQLPEHVGKEDFMTTLDITNVLDINSFYDTLYAWNVSFDNLSDGRTFSNPLYWSLLSSINSKIKELDVLPTPSKLKSNLLRIAIHSLSSPLWGSEYKELEDKKWADITCFFTLLKTLIRSSFSVAMVTVPSHLFADPALISRLLSITDYGIKLESFQGSKKETNPLFKEYHGLFHIRKFPVINSLIPSQVDSQDWAFHIKRKTLSVQKIHLPPELSETTSRSEEVILKGNACMGEKLPQRLDF